MRILILDDDPSRTGLLADAAARGCPEADVRRGPVEERAIEQAVEHTAPGLVVLGPGAADRPEVAGLVRALAARRPELSLLVVSACDAAAPAVAAPPDPHWSFQPVKRPAVPESTNHKRQITNPIGAFILASS